MYGGMEWAPESEAPVNQIKTKSYRDIQQVKKGTHKNTRYMIQNNNNNLR